MIKRGDDYLRRGMKDEAVVLAENTKDRRRVNGYNNCQLAHLRGIGVLNYSEKTRLWSLGPRAKEMMKQHPELWGDID